MLSRLAARRARRRAAREMARRMAELDRLDRELGLGAMPTAVPPPTRRRRSSGAALPGLLVTGLLLAGMVAWTPTDDFAAIRRIFGFEQQRVGPVPEAEWGKGSFEFAMTQPGSEQPVGYSPCREIPLQVNPDGAPDHWERLVDTAVAHTENATGLRFDRLGTTDDRDFQRGNRFAGRSPVLVGWATDDEVSDLAGDVAGIGGSAAQEVRPGHLEYVTGMVVLDAEVFDDGDVEEQQAIIDHEFGHLVGLAHVSDPGELMNAQNVGRTTYGDGDLEGLARLGRIGC